MTTKSAAKKPAKSTGKKAPIASTDSANVSGWRARVLDRSLERARSRSLNRGHSFIEAAQRVLQSKDDDRAGFTVQEVADEAGQSLRTLYQHFANKDELLLALLEESIHFSAEFLQATVNQYTDPTERLIAFIFAGTTVLDNTAYSRALARFRVQLGLSSPEEVAAIEEPVVNIARALIADAVAAGALAECDPDVGAYFIVTLRSQCLHSTLLGNWLNTSVPGREDVVRFALQGLCGTIPTHFVPTLPDLPAGPS